MKTTAAIRFLGKCTATPKLHGIDRHNDHCPQVEEQVVIANARDLHSPPQLDTAGYALVNAAQLPTPRDLKSTARHHLQQSRQILHDLTGASELLVVNSVIRRSERSPGYLQDGTTLPARLAHNDFGAGEKEIERWVNRFATTASYDQVKHRRIAMYNIWRVLTSPPTDVPLALCDVTSLSSEDRVGVQFHEQMPHSEDWVFEMSVYRFNPAQRWVYFPDMQTHELLIFKGFDSDASRAGLTPHAAFTLADCPDHAPARESIESRFLAFF